MYDSKWKWNFRQTKRETLNLQNKTCILCREKQQY